MSLRIINAAQVRDLLPVADCIDAMEAAMRATSLGEVRMPPRQLCGMTDAGGELLLMPVSAAACDSYGAKIISLHMDNPRRGLPAIQGFVALFDAETGAPVALVAGAEITAIRTAAASGLATRLLAVGNAERCGIFGAGVQAESHIDAMLAVRPVREVLIWARDNASAEMLAERTGSQYEGVQFRAVTDASDAAGCDLICTVTGSPTPILHGAAVPPGSHANLVGAHSLKTREADTALIAKSRLYVDSMESCRNEGGDFAIPVEEGAIDWDFIRGEIGQLLAGDIQGRENDEQITVYNSLGIASQDLFSAELVYLRALRRDVGTVVDL